MQGYVLTVVLRLKQLRHSGRSRPGHKVPGTQSKSPNLNENGQKPHFS